MRGSVFERDIRLRNKLGSCGKDFSAKFGDDGDVRCPFVLGLLPSPMEACAPAELEVRVKRRGRAVARGECGGSDRSVSPMSASRSSSIVAWMVIRYEYD